MGLQKKIKEYSQNKFLRNVSILAGGTAFAQVLVIAASPLITRLYTPNDFGVLAVFSALLGILAVSSSLKYHLAIPLTTKDEDAVQLVALSLLINLLFGTITGVVLYVAKPLISASENLSIVIPYLWVLPISIIGFGAYETLKYWAIRENNFKKIAATKISQNTALLITQLGMGFIYTGPLGLVVGDAIGRSGGSISLAILVFKKAPNFLKLVSINKIKQQAIRYKRFPIYSSGSGIFNSLGLQITPLLIASILGPAVAGFYALTQRITSAPLSLIGKSFSHVYYKEAADKANISKKELKHLFLKQSKSLFIFGLIIAIIYIFLGSKGFGFLFGEDWAVSGLYAQILAPMMVLQFLVIPMSQTLNILQKQNLQLAWDILRLLAVLGCFWAVSFFNLQATIAIVCVSGTMTALYFILFVLIYNQVSK